MQIGSSAEQQPLGYKCCMVFVEGAVKQLSPISLFTGVDLARDRNCTSTNDLKDAKIDKRSTGEPSVQQGEYVNLTFEE
ncbi:hypothetical protein MKW98_015417 [Papaver atlanticum]|uniref:Uncharacterized protein n=1 Tax=Papaver atlanticum TaxID=357466 RepID=A0AAD4X4S1_9MAGN|nr:hypothetical protein MKW98_015417 [Papaver atlanticum]